MHQASCRCRLIHLLYRWRTGAQGSTWPLIPSFLLRARTNSYHEHAFGFLPFWGCSVDSTQTCHEVTQTWLTELTNCTKAWLATSCHTHPLTVPEVHFLLSHCPGNKAPFPSWCAGVIAVTFSQFCKHSAFTITSPEDTGLREGKSYIHLR